ncbi:arginine--tRNA ligase, partial [bacterium]|nr:arginine--tRNA ligase [bacterium]
SYLGEFVSPNPTGPLHLAHGRNAIIGDVLARVMEFLGHKVSREMYINDAGKQIDLLGESLLARYKQQLKEDVQVPEKGYHGEYLSDVALEIVKERGSDAVNEPMEYFKRYAVDKMLILIKKDLLLYGVEFDTFFSEKTLHDNGAIDKAVEDLKTNQLVYEKDDALWFKSTEFGDDKDRVVKRSDGAWTYLGADIAYHEDKFKRGYDKLIDVLGQDHHGYLNRIKATMEAMGFGKDKLDIIVYQLVFMRIGNDYVKMSKRSGNFETLSDVINTAGKDVARFFYLNRKADAHLDFDLDVALKNTEENPVYYIQYAYVRINSLMNKAAEISGMSEWVSKLRNGEIDTDGLSLDENDIALVRKISQLSGILRTIANGYQTHMIAYYTLELAKNFSSYYGKVKILDTGRIDATKNRLFVVSLIRTTLGTCLDLLGLSKPEKM